MDKAIIIMKSGNIITVEETDKNEVVGSIEESIKFKGGFLEVLGTIEIYSSNEFQEFKNKAMIINVKNIDVIV